MSKLKYCNSLTKYSRFKTREVSIGDIPLGGNNPIRIQSMTTTDTMDTIGTVNQAIRMIEKIRKNIQTKLLEIFNLFMNRICKHFDIIANLINWRIFLNQFYN